MSTNRLRLHVDQENQHKVGPAKTELRNPAAQDSAPGSVLSVKRPLSAKGNVNEKRARVPLGGKSSNQAIPGLQRSKSSLPSTFQRPALKQQSSSIQGDSKVTKPALTKSNSSLGFFNRPANISAPIPRPTNPHKNSLLPSQDSHRSKELVPLLGSDTLTKGTPKSLPPPSQALKDTFSAATAQLHASKLNSEDSKIRNRDPTKKGAFSPEIESLIEKLAEDENSVETVPERPVSEEYVPPGLSPLSESEAPFFYKDESADEMARMFPPGTEFFTDDEGECSDAERELNTAFHEELTAGTGNNTLGLDPADLEDLLDF